MASQASGWRLVIHGGAGVMPRGSISPEEEADYRKGLMTALDAGIGILTAGGLAIDAVQAAVVALENDPNFNAGHGAVLNRDGLAELDASIMDGRERKAGAVAQVRTVKNPVLAARLAMDTTPHVMFAGREADDLAAAGGLEIVDPAYFVTPKRVEQLKRVMAGEVKAWDRRGTVGAVARDSHRNLAAATSTGGMVAKAPGRIGDSPVIGAGTYADNASAAVSATGHGEMFIRAGVARMICARVELQGMSAQEAADVTLTDVRSLGGAGGVIVVTKDDAAMAMNTDGMFRGEADGAGRKITAIYAGE
ncbi:MAG: isoaspartyl peptidase/L-asparaginase [Alphaproteobacteria bacterium]|nr:isoaspartyl peptidase/L-asparaginase [Alphaproteobacteria bacterium]